MSIYMKEMSGGGEVSSTCAMIDNGLYSGKLRVTGVHNFQIAEIIKSIVESNKFTKVEFISCQICDIDLLNLSKADKISSLNLSNISTSKFNSGKHFDNNVTEAGVKILLSMPNLVELQLDNNPSISPEAIAEAIETLNQKEVFIDGEPSVRALTLKM